MHEHATFVCWGRKRDGSDTYQNPSLAQAEGRGCTRSCQVPMVELFEASKLEGWNASLSGDIRSR